MTFDPAVRNLSEKMVGLTTRVRVLETAAEEKVKKTPTVGQNEFQALTARVQNLEATIKELKQEDRTLNEYVNAFQELFDDAEKDRKDMRKLLVEVRSVLGLHASKSEPFFL